MRIVIPILWAGCGGASTPTDGAPTGETGTGPTFTLPGDLVVLDEDDIAYAATWVVAATTVKANTEVFLDWSAKVSDAWGEPHAADGFDELVMWRVSTDRADTLVRLAADDLDPVTTGTWSVSAAGRTTARLADLGFDAAADLDEDDGTSWLVALTDTVGARRDVRDAVFLVPSATEVGIRVSFPLTTNSASYTVRFGDDTLRTDRGHDRYTVDWGGLTVDAYGKPFDPARVDEVFVGRFDTVGEADDLGGELFDLQAVATGWWALPSTGTSAVLGEAKDVGGAAFPGFEAGTSWLVGGRCTTCLGPAPGWLSVVEVRRP